MVAIRPITREDTPNIISWRNNPRVLHNFIDQNPLDEETHLSWLDNYVDKGKTAQFIICANGADVGSVYLRDICHIHKKAEFGIFIGDDAYTGKGIGTEAARLIIDYGFMELGMNKIFLRVLAENVSAIRSYEKSGFVPEGCFVEDVYLNGFFHDVVFMAILKGSWSKG